MGGLRDAIHQKTNQVMLHYLVRRLVGEAGEDEGGEGLPRYLSLALPRRELAQAGRRDYALNIT